MKRVVRAGRLVAVVVMAAMLNGTSCGSSDGPALPPPPEVVDVRMHEYGFELRGPSAPGRVVFRVANRGQLSHELIMVFLEEDLPPLDQQLRGAERRVVPTFARLPERRPGGSGVFAVDLGEGRYGFVCFIQDPDGVQHAQKGMSTEFRVT